MYSLISPKSHLFDTGKWWHSNDIWWRIDDILRNLVMIIRLKCSSDIVQISLWAYLVLLWKLADVLLALAAMLYIIFNIIILLFPEILPLIMIVLRLYQFPPFLILWRQFNIDPANLQLMIYVSFCIILLGSLWFLYLNYIACSAYCFWSMNCCNVSITIWDDRWWISRQSLLNWI